MNKLSRKEFKNLLIEWNKNYINERSFRSLDVPEWSLEISPEREELVKSVNIDADLINFSIPQDLLELNPKKKLHSIFTNNFSIFPKSEKNYNMIKDAIKDFYKTVVFNPRAYKKSLRDEYEELLSREMSEMGIEDFDSKINFKDIDKKRVLENIENLFRQSKSKMVNKDDVNSKAFFVYLTKTFSDAANLSSGGLYGISKLSDEHANSFLKWLFHHDFMHSIEAFSDSTSGKQIKSIPREKKRETENLNSYFYIKIKGLEDSLGNQDNYASVLPYILNKEESDARKFLVDNYLNYEEYLNFTGSEETFEEYSAIKEKNISDIIEDLSYYKKRFDLVFENLKDYIIVSSYDIVGSRTLEIEDLPEDLEKTHVNYQILTIENRDRIVQHAIDTQNARLLSDVLLSTWSSGLISKEMQLKVINVDKSNKVLDFVLSSHNPYIDSHPILMIVKYTNHIEVVKAACEKYYNNEDIVEGKFGEEFRKIVKENWGNKIDITQYAKEN